MSVSHGIYRKRGTGSMHAQGYKRSPGRMGRRPLEHVAICERVLGKALPKGARVHHWNEDKSDNRGENLVLCPNQSYHFLLHTRMRALAACGNPDWVKCQYCGKYDPLDQIVTHRVYRPKPKVLGYHHAECKAKYMLAYRGKL